jgi:CRP-like cAMP-binding protein
MSGQLFLSQDEAYLLPEYESPSDFSAPNLFFPFLPTDLKGLRIYTPDPDVPREINEIQTKLIRITRPFRVKWDLFSMVLALYNCVTVPLFFAFEYNPSEALLAINTAIDCVFMVDIILNFFTTYISSTGDEVVDCRQICTRYLKRMFLIDFLSSFPIDNFFDALFGKSDYSQALMMTDLMKLVRILRLTRIVRFMRAKDQTKHIFKLMTLFMYLFIWIHLSACFFYAIARQDEEWIPVPDFANGVSDIYEAPLIEQYLTVLYHGVWMLKGNELGPTNAELAAYGGFIMILGALVTAILFGELAVILSSFSRKTTHFQELVETSITTMQKLEIPGTLQQKILEYISTTHASISAQEEYESFMRYISPSLAKEVRRVIYQPVMESNVVMSSVPPTVIHFMLQQLSHQFAKPEEEIIAQGTEPEGFYFTIIGECSVFVTNERNTKTQVCDLVRGSHFGEIALLYDTLTTASVESREYSTVAKLQPEGFRELMSRHPKLARSFMKNTQQYRDEFKTFLLDGISQANYFTFLPEETFHELAYWMKPEQLEQGDYLFKPADPVDSLYFVLEGILELSFTFNDRFVSLLKDRQRIEDITPYMASRSLTDYTQQTIDLTRCDRLKHKVEVVPIEQNYTIIASIFAHESTPIGCYRLGEFLQEVVVQHLTSGTLLCSQLVLLDEIHYLQCKAITPVKVCRLPSNLIFSLCKDHKSYQQQISVLKNKLKSNQGSRVTKLYSPIDILEARLSTPRLKWKQAIAQVILIVRDRRRGEGLRLVKLIPKIKAILACEDAGNFELAQRVIKGEIPPHLITESGTLDTSAAKLDGSLLVTQTHPVMTLIRKLCDSILQPSGSIYRKITSLERIAVTQNKGFADINSDFKSQKQLLQSILSKLDPHFRSSSQLSPRVEARESLDEPLENLFSEFI